MDKYVKIKQIGEGSFGKALLMKRKDDGKMCVIKEIGISKMSRKEQEDSKKEVKVLSQLTHANIVSYMESFEGKGNLYIVMDYCEGGDLYKYIKNQRGAPIEENKVLDIFVQCCLAIKYVHDRKILHRDIKTQNIFLTKDSIVKLGDFGIARVLKSTVELAHTCIGTPYYLSPEIVENRPYNNKSDIWSLGCVLYEMVTLKHAFEAGNMKNLVMKIVRGSYPPISNRYSFEIRSLVAQTFKRSPSDRPSINTILKKPVIQKRIEKFVPREKLEEELQRPKAKPVSQPPISVVEPAAKKPIAAKRRDDIANIYGASLAKKPNRKPTNVANPVVKPKKKVVQRNLKSSNENSKEVAARERRRQNLLEAEKKHLDQMKKMQKDRWQKQHEVKEKKAEVNPLVENEQKKEPLPVKEVVVKKDEKPVYPIKNIVNAKDPAEQKPSNHFPKQVRAWDVPQKPQVHVVEGNLNNEGAKLLQEYWQRKREADANKMRANQDLYGGKVNWKPPMPKNKPVGDIRNKPLPVYPSARNQQEQEYLRQLDAIRYQNFVERRAVNQKGAREHGMNQKGDPRFDPEARKQKMQELKKQAEERAIMLQKQKHVEKQAPQKLENKMQNVWNDRTADIRPLPVQNKIKKAEMVMPPMGIDTVMREVQPPQLLKSCSEGDLQEAIKKADQAQRKIWPFSNIKCINLGNFPMEITASAMEATVDDNADCKSIHPATNQNDKRKYWAHDGKTEFLANLQKKEISGTQAPTWTFFKDTTTEKHLNNADVETSNVPTFLKDCSEINVPDEPASNDESCFKNNIKPPDINTIKNLTHSIQSSPMTNNNITESNSNVCTDSPGKTITISSENANSNNIHPTRNLPVIVQSPNNISSPPNSNTFVISKNPIVTKSLDNYTQPDKLGDDHKLEEPTSDVTRNDTSTILLSSDNTSSTVVLSSDNTISSTVVLSSDNKISSTVVLSTEDDLNKSGGNSNEVKTQTVSPSADSFTQSIVECVEKTDVLSEKVECSEGIATDNSECNEEIISEDIEHCPNPFIVKTLPKEMLPISIKQPVEAWTEQKSPGNEADNMVVLRDITVHEDTEEDFHTPNRTLGLQTGVYDTATKLLRTCSLPELNTLNTLPFVSPISDEDEKDDENESALPSVNLVEKFSRSDDGNHVSVVYQKDIVKEDEGEMNLDEFDDDEVDDYASMLESMSDLLSNTEEDNTIDENDSNDEESEDWESDDDDDDEVCVKTAKEKDLKLKEDVFSRNEESRKRLEDELGLELFLKVYKHLQALQDDENDELELGTVEISTLLGDKEYLYQKVLYLVLADAAYCEGNDGLE